MAQAVLVGKPGGALGVAEEGWPGFQTMEPLSKITAGYPRDPGNKVLVQLWRVGQ
jgi:hypothetical protein